jgi:hypothetical protein
MNTHNMHNMHTQHTRPVNQVTSEFVPLTDPDYIDKLTQSDLVIHRLLNIQRLRKLACDLSVVIVPTRFGTFEERLHPHFQRFYNTLMIELTVAPSTPATSFSASAPVFVPQQVTPASAPVFVPQQVTPVVSSARQVVPEPQQVTPVVSSARQVVPEPLQVTPVVSSARQVVPEPQQVTPVVSSFSQVVPEPLQVTPVVVPAAQPVTELTPSTEPVEQVQTLAQLVMTEPTTPVAQTSSSEQLASPCTFTNRLNEAVVQVRGIIPNTLKASRRVIDGENFQMYGVCPFYVSDMENIKSLKKNAKGKAIFSCPFSIWSSSGIVSSRDRMSIVERCPFHHVCLDVSN